MKAARAGASATLNNMKSQMVNQTDSNLANIKWNEYNYPPLIRVIHYDPSELQEPHQGAVRKINWCFIGIVLVCIINVINSIAQAAGPDDYSSINILYSFLNLVLFIPVSFWVFYKGYLGICKETSNIRWYQIGQGLLCIAWIIFSIIYAGAINGFVRMGQLFGDGYGFQAVLSLIESLLYLAVAGLGIFNIWKIRDFE